MAMTTTTRPCCQRGEQGIWPWSQPLPIPEKEGVTTTTSLPPKRKVWYMAMTTTTNPPLSKGEQGIWPWSQPFPFPEKEGVTTTTPLPPKRKVWYMAMTITTNPLCQKGNKISGHDLAMITTIPFSKTNHIQTNRTTTNRPHQHSDNSLKTKLEP